MRQTISHKHLNQWLDNIRLSRLTPLILGAVGVGKTQHAIEYANLHNLEPIIIPLDSMYEMDVVGYAVPNKTDQKFHYFPSTFFPVEGDKTPEGKEGWLIIIDEFGNCGASMQTAAQRLIFERIVGQHKLHEKAEFIILGNTVEAGANANPISSAVLSRCAVTELKVTSQDFLDYLASQGYPAILSDVYSTMLNSATVVSSDASPEQSMQEGQEGQEAIFTHRGYEQLCVVVSGKASVPSDCLQVLKEMSLDTDTNTAKSVLGDYYGSLFTNAVSKLLANVQTKYAAFIQADGKYPVGIADVYTLPVVLSKLFTHAEFLKLMNNFITHNLANGNTEELTSVLTAVETSTPELLAHTQFDRVKAQLINP